MDSKVRNFLYRNPQFCELVYPKPNDETPQLCRRLFERFLAQPPASILDIGCGTARDLESLRRDGADCWGIDFLPEMIAYARESRPGLRLQVGDMRSLRLGRTFDVIMCMGSAFMYPLTNEEVGQTLETFAVHAHPGTLLVLDINNAASYLGGDHFKPTSELIVSLPDFSARAQSTLTFDRRNQRLVRHRTWHIDGRDPIQDTCEYHMHFPMELESLLATHRFAVRGMFDNKELAPSELCGPRLYVAASSLG